MSKLLGMLYYYPPMGSVAAYRTYDYFYHLSFSFDKTYIIQSKHHYLPNQNKYDHSFLEYRKYSPNYDHRWIKSLLKAEAQSDHNQALEDSILVNGLFKFIESPLGAHTIGEGGGIYLLKSYLTAKKIIKNEGISHIFSNYRPLSDLMIGYYLKLRFPWLKWIVDMRDYHIRFDVNNYFSRKWRDRIFYKILRKADVITTVSAGISELYRKNLALETLTIPNGIRIRESQVDYYSTFKISYTGSIYSFYDMGGLLRSLAAWVHTLSKAQQKKIRIEYAGRNHQTWDHYIAKHDLEHVNRTNAVLSRKDAQRIQSESSINLFASYSSPEYYGVLTGKLSDIIGAQRPILGWICGDRDSELADYFKSYELGKLFYSSTADQHEFEDFLNHYFVKWQHSGGNLYKINNEAKLKELSWEKRMKIIAAKL